jgi:hypothetical protein
MNQVLQTTQRFFSLKIKSIFLMFLFASVAFLIPKNANATRYLYENIKWPGVKDNVVALTESRVMHGSTITVDPCNISISLSMTKTSCPSGNDGTATVSHTGNGTSYSVLWSTSATSNTITGLKAGKYFVTVTDNFGCWTTDSIMVDFYADTTAPSITCQSNLSLNTDSNVCGAIVNFNAPGATDNCQITISGPDTFKYTGAVQYWVVPNGITSINVSVFGAAGGLATTDNITGDGIGGLGGSVKGNISVTPGETLTIRVGGRGTDANDTISGSGGFNGGGNGAAYYDFYTSASGGGGGASDITRIGIDAMSQKLVVGAGGGGTGTDCELTLNGGDGGGLNGSDGAADCSGDDSRGMGGTQTAGGTGGIYYGQYPGDDGALGIGGNANSEIGLGGGGGAGYYGGGAGAMGGGGGGSSFIISSATGVSYTTGTRQGDGIIIINYSRVFPVVTQIAGPASGSFFPVGNTAVTFKATDESNNSSTCSFNVTVTDNINPTITCPSNISTNNDAGLCSAIIVLGTPTTADNCGVQSVTNNHESTTYTVGTTTVTWTVTDIHGNTTTCTQAVVVTDNENPVITCPSNKSVNNDAGNCSAVVNIGTPASSDNCGVQSVTNNHASTTYPIGTTTVTWTVTDIHGNTASCNQSITVTDNENPVVHTKNISVTLSGGSASIVPSQVNNESTDNCGITSYSVSPSTFNCSNIGANTVTLTVIDIHGHSSSATAIVTVIGNLSVSISQSMLPGFCQGGAVVLKANAPAGVTYLWSTGATTQSINVYASGTYTVTVANGSGCTASSSTTVSYTSANMLSSYTIIATKEVEFESHTFVQTGGVGVTCSYGEIEVEDHSTITGTGTFARAHDIDVHNGSTVTTKISTATPVNLPAFKNNPYHNSGSNITVANNASVTLNDSIYKNINIGSNATVTFTKPVVYIKKLTTNSNARIKFSNCAILKIDDKTEIGPYNQFNPDEQGVVVYAGDELDIDKGSTINASVYCQENIATEGTNMARVTMKGIFIAEKIESEYTTWNWNTTNSGCSLNKTEPLVTENGNTNSTLTDEIEFNVFPNPTTGKFNIEINSTLEGALKITVYDYLGQEVKTILKSDFTGTASVKVDLHDAASTYYIVKVEMAGKTLYKKVMLTRLY